MRLTLLFALALPGMAETAPTILSGRAIASLWSDGERVFAETDRGVFAIERYGVRSVRSDGVPPDRKTALDFAGYRWEATADGIRRTRKHPHFTRFELPNSDRVHALAAGADGSIWCGSQHGVARYRNGRFSVAKAELGVVTTVAVDRDGAVWIGSGSAFTGTWRLDGKTWVHVEGIDAFVHKIAMDEAGTLWFAALNAPGGDRSKGRGAWYWSEGGFRAADWLTGERVYDVAARDPSGVLWFATLRGLVAYRGNGRVKHYSPTSGELSAEKVWCLSAASDGSLWLGYQNDGAGVSRLAGGTMSHFTVAEGLCSDQVWAVTEGRRGVYWIATDNGLSRYDGLRWSCFRFTEAPLWPLLPRPDGSLWIGSLRDGLWRFTPSDREAPRTDLRAEGGHVSWNAVDAWMDSPAAEVWTRSRVNRGPWSRARPGGAGELALGPGRHEVEVQAIDRYGNAEDPPRRITVEVDDAGGFPWWAVLIAVAAAIGFLFSKRGSAVRAT